MVNRTFVLMAFLLAFVWVLSACGTDNLAEQTLGGETKSKRTDLSFIPALGGEEFDTPVGIRHAGDGSGRLFVVEQPGRIIVLSGDVRETGRSVFLDLTQTVYNKGWEQGLLGLAFHPDYERNGKFYVNYTTEHTTVIAEYKRSSADPTKADPNSARKLLEFDQPFENHNGGELAFGPDGYLYIAAGDGGSGGDPMGNGQNRQTLLGKILRIDVDHTSDGKPYAIPADNPFISNDSGYREEIYAYGLRNPWRFSFDPETGKLWAADVGQNRVEEINTIENGKNYGWNIMEGGECYNSSHCADEGLALPVWEYAPDGKGASITGGYVYRGKSIPSLSGKYVFADFIDGRIWTLDVDAKGQSKGQSKAVAEELDVTLPNITSFGTDEAGELYACLYDGAILQLTGK